MGTRERINGRDFGERVFLTWEGFEMKWLCFSGNFVTVFYAESVSNFYRQLPDILIYLSWAVGINKHSGTYISSPVK